MAIIFPINPQQDQQYTPQGIPITWQYDSGRNAWRVVRTGPTWNEVVGKPHAFPPEPHDHPIAEVNGLQSILDVKQDISARGVPNGYPSLDETGKVPENQLPFGVGGGGGDWNDITNKPSTFPPSPHTHPVAQISDSGSTGQQLVRAPTAADARSIIGAIGIDDNARVTVKREGAIIGVRRAFNLHEGTNVTMSVVDDVASEEVDITINAAGGGGGSSLVVSDIKPVAPTDNTMWLDTTTGIQFVYYNDGTSSQWIESTPYLSAMPAVFTKFDFPTAPVNDQTYNPIPGATWKWSSTRGVWYAVSTTSGAYTKAEADAKFVDVIGDAMTGPLTVVHPPTANTHAASKQYVDSRPGLTVSDTPPSSPVDGALWWESDSGLLYVRYNDGTSAQWVIASPQPDFAGFLRLDSPQMATAAQQQQGRQNIYAAPFDAMAYSGMQINGGFDVSQELQGTAISTVGAAYGAFVCDGWRFDKNGTHQVTAAQSGSGLFGPPGLFYITCGTAQTSLTANDYCNLSQQIEGTRVARMLWGTANAQPITIAFWVAHHRTGTYSVTVQNAGGARSYATTYTQNAADQPEYKTITIPGDTTGTWSTTNTSGAKLNFSNGCGTTYTAPSTGSWLVGNYIAAPGQVNGVGATSDAFRLGQVIVLPGNEAPISTRSSFVMRPYTQELETCKRYWQSYGQVVVTQNQAASTTVYFSMPYSPSMRSSPTVTFPNLTYSNGSALATYGTVTANVSSFSYLAGAGMSIVNTGITFDARL